MHSVGTNLIGGQAHVFNVEPEKLGKPHFSHDPKEPSWRQITLWAREGRDYNSLIISGDRKKIIEYFEFVLDIVKGNSWENKHWHEDELKL